MCAQGGAPRSDAEAGAQAWQQMLEFFEEARDRITARKSCLSVLLLVT